MSFSKLGYDQEKDRSGHLIFRFTAKCLKFACLQQSVVGIEPKAKTNTVGSMYGLYYHNLTIHAVSTIRLINLTSTNAEKGEASIGRLNKINKETGNGKSEYAFKNAIERFSYMSNNMKQKRHSRHVGKLAEGVRLTGHTVIPADWFAPSAFQFKVVAGYLRYLADFLLLGEGVSYEWATNGSLILLDSLLDEPYIPKDFSGKMQYRSSSFTDVFKHCDESLEKLKGKIEV